METNISLSEVIEKLNNFSEKLTQMEIDMVNTNNELLKVQLLMNETNILIDAILAALTTNEIIEA